MNRNLSRPTWAALAAAAAALVTALVVVTVGVGGGHVAAAATTPGTPDTVTVTGVGKVQGVPDTLDASFGVHVQRGSVQDALNASDSAARRLIASLRSHGLARADIQTADLSIGQSYDNHGNVNGYDADETVTAHIHPLSHVGRTLQAAATSAGNAVRLDNISFDITDNTALLDAARTDAFNRAKAAATQYAGLSSRRLGRVVRVSESVTSNKPDYFQSGGTAGTAGVAAAEPLQPGQQPVTVTVTVAWSLQ